MKCIISLIFPMMILLTSASCKKSSSTEVDNGFACKIDGKVWRPYSNDFKLKAAEVNISQNGEQIAITARNINTRGHLSILVSTPGSIVTTGKYNLVSDRYLFGSFYYYTAGSSEQINYITGNGYKGEIEILTIDKVNFRITGKFHFTAYNDQLKQSVTITEGNFNLRYEMY